MLLIGNSLTGIFRLRRKDDSAWESIYRGTYANLRRIAAALLRSERRNHTLQPTALVNESFLKLRSLTGGIDNEDHFYNLSARAMRQILVDHSRSHNTAKRSAPESLAEVLGVLGRKQLDRETELTLHASLAALRKLDAAAACVIQMRCLEGYTIEEVAASMNREAWRVRVDFEFGLDWMASRWRRPPQPTRLTAPIPPPSASHPRAAASD